MKRLPVALAQIKASNILENELTQSLSIYLLFASREINCQKMYIY